MAQSAATSGSTLSSTVETAQATPHTSTNPPQNEAANAEDAEDAEDAEELDYAPLQVGDATQGLLAWQRSGDIASKTPRPIGGSVAQRSYERYLKSFEFPIPERLSSSVKSTTGSGGAK
ncbi:DUF3613 domain-containing protein [Variovorax sp. VRV01]|nr:DUF3613 domain-containing protein [Variovorax sp. VRV01]